VENLKRAINTLADDVPIRIAMAIHPVQIKRIRHLLDRAEDIQGGLDDSGPTMCCGNLVDEFRSCPSCGDKNN
jgi:hypothetical protein